MSIKPVKVGIIGCGAISPAYFKGCKLFPILDVVACADIDMSRAHAKAAEYGVRPCSDEELLADPDIEIVIDITWPKAHTLVNLMAIEAGKHVHCEKPLAINRADGLKTVLAAREAAGAKGVRLGCAPDTFLGGAIQTCRKLIDDGWIGEPVAAVAFLTNHGHESWHPDPEFYYEIGGGPMLDMGPYYLTTLVNLIGPIKRVTGSTRITFPERVITSQPKFGKHVKVEVPTYVSGVLDFANGAVGTIITTFDVWAANLPRIEIYGTQGSLSVPDPNRFDGTVMVRRAGADAWSEMPHTHSVAVSRGVGVADLAYAIRSGRPHRCNGDLAYHVLDVMCAFEESSRSSKHVDIKSTCPRPAALPTGLLPGELDR